MFQGARELDNQMIPLTEFAFRNAADDSRPPAVVIFPEFIR